MLAAKRAAIEMRGALHSTVSGSGVDVTLLRFCLAGSILEQILRSRWPAGKLVSGIRPEVGKQIGRENGSQNLKIGKE